MKLSLNLKAQLSLDFLLAVIIAILFLSLFQSISNNITINASKINAREQAREIAGDIALLLEASTPRYAVIPAAGYYAQNFVNEYAIPFIYIKGIRTDCNIYVFDYNLNIQASQVIDNEIISIDENVRVINPLSTAPGVITPNLRQVLGTDRILCGTRIRW